MATSDEWKGRTGQEWARHGDALDLLLGPAGRAGLKQLNPAKGDRVLDLGCGAGESTLDLLTLIAPGGHVTAVDISPDLIAAAADRLKGRTDVSLVEANAETHAFEKVCHDAVYSRFGAMFFDNPDAAFANIRSTIKPGGRAVFVAWREATRNQWASVPMTFVTEGAMVPGPMPGPGPFAWADKDMFVPVLENADFHDISVKPHEFMAVISAGDDPDPVQRAVAFMSRIGPLAARLRGASDEAKREAKAFLSQRLARHVHDGAVRLLASAWIISAQTGR